MHSTEPRTYPRTPLFALERRQQSDRRQADEKPPGQIERRCYTRRDTQTFGMLWSLQR